MRIAAWADRSPVKAIQQQNDASTAQIIADLTSEERDRRIAGHIKYIRIPRHERNAELYAALVESLAKKVATGHANATVNIPPIPGDGCHDFIEELMAEVATLRNPENIQLQRQLIRTGSGIPQSLVGFGRVALLPSWVARIDGEQPARETAVSSVLMTMRFFIEAWGLEDLTAEEQAEIRRVAVQFMDLKTGEYPTNTEHTSWQECHPVRGPIRLADTMQLA